jgi:hypothetical protein
VSIVDIEPKGCLAECISIANRQAEIKTRPNGTQSGISRMLMSVRPPVRVFTG